jgi:hypothetical protein
MALVAFLYLQTTAIGACWRGGGRSNTPSDLSAAALTARRLLEALATHTQGQEKSASAHQRRYSSTVHDTLIAVGLGVERDPNPGVEAVDMAFNLTS